MILNVQGPQKEPEKATKVATLQPRLKEFLEEKKSQKLLKNLGIVKVDFPKSQEHSRKLFNFFNIYLFLRDRERQSTSGGGEEREGDTESKAVSRLRAVSTEPGAGLELTNCEIMT